MRQRFLGEVIYYMYIIILTKCCSDICNFGCYVATVKTGWEPYVLAAAGIQLSFPTSLK